MTGDFLAWFPSEEVGSIWADVLTIGVDASSLTVPSFNLKWGYGFRVGAGYDLIYDEWDTTLYWTWFRAEGKHTIPPQPSTLVTPEFFASFLSGDSPQSMVGKWALLFNMFDWELGRSYWVSEHLSLRPFLGIKGGWINQSIHVLYNNLIINKALTSAFGKEHLKNDFWGIGPLGGINTKWRLRDFDTHFFDFFGDFSVATLWGRWSFKDIYNNSLLKTSTVNIPDQSLGALMFRGFVGIGWEIDIYNSHLATKLGYEMQLWVNQLRIPTFQLQILHNDLTLQGVTFNCRLDF